MKASGRLLGDAVGEVGYERNVPRARTPAALAGSGDKQAAVEHGRVEIEQVAVALGPAAGCEVVAEVVHCRLLGVRSDSAPDRHAAADVLVEVRLGPAPVGLVEAVSAVPGMGTGSVRAAIVPASSASEGRLAQRPGARAGSRESARTDRDRSRRV